MSPPLQGIAQGGREPRDFGLLAAAGRLDLEVERVVGRHGRRADVRALAGDTVKALPHRFKRRHLAAQGRLHRA